MENETANRVVERIAHRRQYWVPACGGTEKPFKSRSGVRLHYMWNPGTGEHAYLNLDTDIFLTNEEAFEILDK